MANAAVPIAAPPQISPQQYEEFQRYLTAQALIKKAYGCRAASIFDSGVDSSDILLDTGSTFHFSGEIGEGGLRDAPPVDVITAAGV